MDRAAALALRLAAVFALLALPACSDGDVPAAAAEPAAGRLEPVALPEEVAAFYRDRGFRPLWAAGSRLRPEAHALLGLIVRSGRDGFDPERYGAAALKAAVAAAGAGDEAAVARADLMLSRAYAAYLQDLRRPADSAGMTFIDQGLAPSPPPVRALLDSAAAAPALGGHLGAAQRMHPLYERLRRGYEAGRGRGLAPQAEALVRANLERARMLPADPGRRHVVVDAAGARLWMVEGGRIVDSMRVVVGKPGQATPMMAGLIRFAVLNPYWNVPPDLVPGRIARNVLRHGPRYLRRERFELLSDWSAEARPLHPSKVDWKSVAAGKRILRVRQLPGPGNMMGAVKFMMPNRLGIYLHDTPDKSLFGRSDRHLSSGCVRVEDAARLSRWLFQGPPPAPSGRRPEQRVDLPEPVPVYITYFSAAPAEGRIAFQGDPYKRDPALLARLGFDRRAGGGVSRSR